MFFKQAVKGNNNFWFYLLTLVGVVLAIQLIGGIPLMVAVFSKTLESGSLVTPENVLDFAGMGINPVLGLVLLIFPFMVGLGALYLFVRYLHRKPFISILSARNPLDYNKIIFAAGLWSLLLLVSIGIHLIIAPENYSFQFQPGLFFLLVVIVLLFIPFQTSFEEIFFRGYLMQGVGLIFKNRWVPLLLTSVIFGLLHIVNPEVKEYGFAITMPQYIGWGLLFGLITIMDDGLELALGTHAANNMFLSLFMTHDNAAIQTPALFKATQLNPVFDLIEFYIFITLFVVIVSIKYKWKDWSKLFSRFSPN